MKMLARLRNGNQGLPSPQQFPLLPSSQDSVLPLQGAWVRSLVRGPGAGWGGQDPACRRMARPKKKKEGTKLALPDIKTYYKAITIKSLILAYEQTDQWKRTDLNTYANLVYLKYTGKDELGKWHRKHRYIKHNEIPSLPISDRDVFTSLRIYC